MSVQIIRGPRDVPTFGAMDSLKIHSDKGQDAASWSDWFDYYWRFKGAASYVASKTDLLSGQLLVPFGGVAEPGWNAGQGLTFTLATEALDTQLVPASTWSMMVQFASIPATAVGNMNMVAGSQSAGSTQLYCWPRNNAGGLNRYTYGHGASANSANGLWFGDGNMCVVPTQGYRDGVADLAIGAWVGIASNTVAIGAHNSGVIAFPVLGGSITAVGIKTTAMMPAQIALAHAAMAAL